MSDIERPETETGNCAAHGQFLRWKTAHGWTGSCPTCREIEQARREQEYQDRAMAERIGAVLEAAEIPPRFTGKRLKDYRCDTPLHEKAIAACREYLENAQARVEAGACLVFCGPPGVGKTHLLTAMVNGLCRQLIGARYATAIDFLAAVKGSWAWHGEGASGPFVWPQVLALDEVWIPQTGRDAESLMALIDARYRRGAPTFIGTNLTPSEMKEHLGERFCDRLREGGGKVIAIEGKSFRTERACLPTAGGKEPNPL